MTTESAAMLSTLLEHPLRSAIDREVHARPFEELRAPVQASHLALLSGRDAEAVDRDRRHVARLCASFQVPPPAADAVHASVDCGPFRLKWERHLEFSTYTVFCPLPPVTPFDKTAICTVPEEWLQGLAGEMLVASHVVILPGSAPPLDMAQLHALFGTTNIAGSRVTGGAAEVWSDFRIHEDGFGRILIKDNGMRERQTGRLVQRLLDIETYRTLALLAHPLARQVSHDITDVERCLSELTGDMVHLENVEQEHTLLTRLSELAGEIERSVNSTLYRFGATRAYYALVERRLREIREERIEGSQTIREFMDRRLAPAISAIESVADRQRQLAARVSRAADLLRTRVDVALERQNGDLLKSVNQRLQLQIRLQETVEGLSVVVITYYTLGVLSYAAKALAKAGLPINPDLVVGLAIPVVLGGVWWGLRRLRRRLADQEAH
ncbi:MAG: DUF3422 domain-containing protein [Pseudomonadota bacterium]|nr:DUF3422 domain-containing protein [Pseudomonadota bacterium]